MMTKKQVKSFKDIIFETPDLKGHYKDGLQALKSEHAKKIIVENTRGLGGSVEIDEATREKYPQENRWDYIFEYDNKIYFVEVHNAIAKEVKVVLKKLEWLKNWLKNSAQKLNEYKNKSYYWIPSKKIDFITKPPNKYTRQLAQNNLLLKKELRL